MYDYNFGISKNPKKNPEKFLIFVKRLLPRWANGIADSECIAIFRILKLLKHKNYIPAIFFVFSKRRCEQYAKSIINSLITDDDFLKKAKESIEAADGWKYGYYIDGEENSLKDVIDYVSYGDSILIRLISVGEKELTFLSVDNFSDDGKEEFLKGTSYESKLDDDDFEDNYNDCVNGDNLLAFDYVINYEG